MVVCFWKFVPFKRNAGIKNKVWLLPDKPCDMPVRKLGRVAFRFAWDAFNALFVNFTRRLRGQYRAEIQFFKKYSPERIIFVHIEHPWNTDCSADGFFFRKRFIIKHAFVFKRIQIWNILLFFLLSKAALAAVSGNIAAVLWKLADGQKAAVCAVLASGELCFKGQGVDFVNRKHGRRFFRSAAFPGN